MKNLLYKILCGSFLFGTFACQDFEEKNVDPNNPEKTPTNMLMAGVEKRMMDRVYDNWFSGRQCLVYSQYWSQRNYTEEDRYQIRESTNNNYYNSLYQCIANLDAIIKMNTDPATADEMSAYGANANQIAAAKVMKAWLFQLMTDTWGAIPYTEAGKLTEGLFNPKYDDQKDIYNALIAELTEAANSIDVNEPAFVSGDRIFNGDASKWKKFANSLKCRIAIHLSKVDPNWKQYISEAVQSGVFGSNADNAVYKYSTTAPAQCKFYLGFFDENRNDFTITRPFVDILKGQRDTLNAKTHPWEGVVDPRLPVYTTDRKGTYVGIPLGIPSSELTSDMRNTAPTWYSTTLHPVTLDADFSTPLMTYAEVQFILSEYKGFSAEEYKTGVRASLDYWGSLRGDAMDAQAADAYVEAVSKKVDAEAVALQKYIDLFMNGTEGWTEYRRTGYPTQLLKPNEISCVSADGNPVKFSTLSETKGDIIARVKYPTIESTLNGENFNNAVSKLQDGSNNYYSKMYWDVRTASDPHPANK